MQMHNHSASFTVQIQASKNVCTEQEVHLRQMLNHSKFSKTTFLGVVYDSCTPLCQYLKVESNTRKLHIFQPIK